MIQVDPLSYIPLHLFVYYNKTKLADATGFTVRINGSRYLITNWHVVSGRNPETGKCLSDKAAIPNKLQIWFHADDDEPLTWLKYEIPLRDSDDNELWLSHPNKSEVDVVAIPLNENDLVGVDFKDLNLALSSTGLFMHPSEHVSILGYPFGTPSNGELPIWKTGHIASDVELDYQRKPVFLVDATTREGMSGSLVIARKFNHPVITDPSQPTASSYVDHFLGIYSGRIAKGDAIEVGMVWKPKVIEAIILEE